MKNIVLEREFEINIDLDELIVNYSSLELINHTINNFNKKVEQFNFKLNNLNTSMNNINKLIEKEMWYINHNSIDPNKVTLVENYKLDVQHYLDQIEDTKLQQNHWINFISLLNKIKTSLEKVS